MNDPLIKAVKELIADIESMQMQDDPNWFGPFSHTAEDGSSMKWPNLTISAEAVKKELAKLKP